MVRIRMCRRGEKALDAGRWRWLLFLLKSISFPRRTESSIRWLCAGTFRILASDVDRGADVISVINLIRRRAHTHTHTQSLLPACATMSIDVLRTIELRVNAKRNFQFRQIDLLVPFLWLRFARFHQFNEKSWLFYGIIGGYSLAADCLLRWTVARINDERHVWFI